MTTSIALNFIVTIGKRNAVKLGPSLEIDEICADIIEKVFILFTFHLIQFLTVFVNLDDDILGFPTAGSCIFIKEFLQYSSEILK